MLPTTQTAAAVNSAPLTFKGKLTALVSGMLQDSKIPAMYRPTVSNLVLNFINQTDEEQLKQTFRDLQDKLIPWLLE